MSQDNLDNRIKEVFGSMDEYDQKEASNRKEEIWQRTNPKSGKECGNKWLLILLLGTLFFAAGWLAKSTQIIETNSNQPQDKIESNQTNQFANATEETKHNMIERELDSLFEINRHLSIELAAMNEKYNAMRASKSTISTNYLRDTVIVTEVKIHEQIVERIIKDTILIEVPVQQENQPIIAMINTDESKKNDPDATTENLNEKPTSVQFNFRDTNQIDK